jgi:hypothetical protein
MENENRGGLSPEELAEESAVALPDKEVVSILDLNADLDLAIDAAAPIDLSVAANANVAAPIDAAVGANVLSEGSTAQALSDQGVAITQGVDADAIADSSQGSVIEQGAAPAADAPLTTDPAAADPTTLDPTAVDPTAVDPTLPDTGSMLDGNLLDVDVDLDADANLAAPINGAVAANANVAAPIDAAVAANIGSVDSEATAVSQQDAIINQTIDGTAQATADQESGITQPDQPQP